MRHAARASGRSAVRLHGKTARVRAAHKLAATAAPRPDSAPAGSAGRASRARFEQLPYLIVLAGIVLSLLTIRQGAQQVRGGTLVMAGVLLFAAMARLVLPDYRAGLLASRRRLWDVATFLLLGSGLLVAGLVLPAPS